MFFRRSSWEQFPGIPLFSVIGVAVFCLMGFYIQISLYILNALWGEITLLCLPGNFQIVGSENTAWIGQCISISCKANVLPLVDVANLVTAGSLLLIHQFSWLM